MCQSVSQPATALALRMGRHMTSVLGSVGGADRSGGLIRALSFATSRRETTIKLYGFPFSPNTWKVRAVAADLEEA
jgi:hypothetical protein